jgi:hypothetical protein
VNLTPRRTDWLTVSRNMTLTCQSGLLVKPPASTLRPNFWLHDQPIQFNQDYWSDFKLVYLDQTIC